MLKPAKASKTAKKSSLYNTIGSDMRLNWQVYLMVLPVIAFYVLFAYKPIYGAILAFKNFKPGLGIMGSPWVGFANFEKFFGSVYFTRLLRNTITISVTGLVFGFPLPILFAVLLNEIKFRRLAKTVQTVTYMPHFISLVIICGLVSEFTSNDGIVTEFFRLFGYSGGRMLDNPALFVPIHVISGMWQNMGWDSIIYISAILGVDAALYEAAEIDGAGRISKIWHITLPGILPTVITMLILRVGSIMNVGFEKIILLYNPATYETADVISSYVYRVGLQDFQYGYSTAVGLFNSVINFVLVFGANVLSRRLTETSLW